MTTLTRSTALKADTERLAVEYLAHAGEACGWLACNADATGDWAVVRTWFDTDPDECCWQAELVSVGDASIPTLLGPGSYDENASLIAAVERAVRRSMTIAALEGVRWPDWVDSSFPQVRIRFTRP